MFYVGVACILACIPLYVYSRLMMMQAEVGRMVARMRADGVDPDTVFLGAIARIQARERHRWRSPVRWVSIKYVQWSRRTWVR